VKPRPTCATFYGEKHRTIKKTAEATGGLGRPWLRPQCQFNNEGGSQSIFFI